jgi:hypothetical protein
MHHEEPVSGPSIPTSGGFWLLPQQPDWPNVPTEVSGWTQVLAKLPVSEVNFSAATPAPPSLDSPSATWPAADSPLSFETLQTLIELQSEPTAATAISPQRPRANGEPASKVVSPACEDGSTTAARDSASQMVAFAFPKITQLTAAPHSIAGADAGLEPARTIWPRIDVNVPFDANLLLE